MAEEMEKSIARLNENYDQLLKDAATEDDMSTKHAYVTMAASIRREVATLQERLTDLLRSERAAGPTEDTATVVRREIDRVMHGQATTERSDKDVGAYVYNSERTVCNADFFFDASLPAGPSAIALEKFISSLPEAFCKAYDERPPKGFVEDLDAAVLNPLLFRSISAWLKHGTLDKDSGSGTELLSSVFAGVLPEYWSGRLKRTTKKAAAQAAPPEESEIPTASAPNGPEPHPPADAVSEASTIPSAPAKPSTPASELLGVLPSGFLRDTHSKGLTNPAQQPDRLINAGTQVLWATTVSSHGDKASLKAGHQLDTGRGQLMKTAKRVFAAQASRAFMVGVLMSCEQVEVWRFYRNGRACCSRLLDLSLSPSSAGLQILFRVLSATASQLGYLPPLMPPEFQYGGVSFSKFERLTPSRTEDSDSSDYFGMEDLHGRRRTGRAVFSATAEREGFAPQDVVLKFYDGAATEAEIIASLEDLPHLPRVMVHGKGPADWADFLAITPKGEHYSVLAHDSLTILRGMRDTARTLGAMAERGWVHGDLTPGNVMATTDAAGMLQLLLTDFHGAGRLGSSSLPTTECFSAVALSLGEKPSLMTDLESTLYTFLHIATCEGLLWKRSIWGMAAAKVMTMTLEFEKQLELCPGALRPAFLELRKLFWLGTNYHYRPPQSDAKAQEAADKFASLCEKHMEKLSEVKRRPGRPKGRRKIKPSSPAAPTPLGSLKHSNSSPTGVQCVMQLGAAQMCSCRRAVCHVKVVPCWPVPPVVLGI